MDIKFGNVKIPESKNPGTKNLEHSSETFSET